MNLLGYLNDHLAGAAAGIQLAERCRDRDPGGELGLVLQALVIEIEQDRDVLKRVIRVLGGSPNTIKQATALGAERLGSLRMWLPMVGTGSVESARLEEVEVLSLGIEGKRLMWALLAQLSSTDARLRGFPFSDLKQRARSQRARLERFRLRLGADALGPSVAPMQATAQRLTNSPGGRPDEVSNWAKPGLECRHNLGYWERRPYLGLGAGAHSYRGDRRWWNVRPPEEQLSLVESGRLPIGGDELLEPSDAHLEEVFLRLRILEGVPSSWVEDERSAPFFESGLLLESDGALVPTERGMLVLNELALVD